MALGIAHESLPAMAFNTLDGALYPFPPNRRLTTEAIAGFARDYRTGSRPCQPPPPPPLLPSVLTGHVSSLLPY